MSGERKNVVDGLISVRSSYGPEDTMNRFESEVAAKRMKAFARVDYAARAETTNLPLRPTDLLIFGNRGDGAPLLHLAQTIGIDLPLKALVWQDAEGITWLSYNDPAWLAARHGLHPDLPSTADAMAGILNTLARNATR